MYGQPMQAYGPPVTGFPAPQPAQLGPFAQPQQPQPQPVPQPQQQPAPVQQVEDPFADLLGPSVPQQP